MGAPLSLSIGEWLGRCALFLIDVCVCGVYMCMYGVCVWCVFVYGVCMCMCVWCMFVYGIYMYVWCVFMHCMCICGMCLCVVCCECVVCVCVCGVGGYVCVWCVCVCVLYMCVSVCVVCGMCMPQHACGGERTVLWSQLCLLPFCGSRGPPQVIGFGRGALLPLVSAHTSCFSHLKPVFMQSFLELKRALSPVAECLPGKHKALGSIPSTECYLHTVAQRKAIPRSGLSLPV